MKKILIILLFILVYSCSSEKPNSVQGNAPVLSFYLAAEKGEQGIMFKHLSPGRKMSVKLKNTPELVLFKNNIKQSDFSKKSFGLAIKFNLDNKSANKFSMITMKNINKKLFVVFNNTVIVGPVIREQIKDGKIMISLANSDIKVYEKLKQILK